ncbi:MAG: carboxypeptidase regulatory-like domain-containing protein [Vicinamibacterales bacterium]
MKRIPAGFLVVVVLFSVPTAAAQTTGSINGTVADNTGAVLPGVTVSATSPVLMGVQTSVTNEQGAYRFPSLPPGTYRLAYELAGFSNIVREDIVVNIGFAATINVQMQVAALQETVTVTGASPVVDVTNSNQQTNFTQEALQNLPNARDIWSLIGQAPGMMVTRFDVGGSRAGTQTGFSAFGYSGQVRVQVDGVNTTEGTGAAGFYYDYGSFDELQLGTDGNDAQAATPGAQVNAVIKSGGNQFRGDLYLDYENQKLQGRNIDDRLARLGVGEGTRILKYRDPNISGGGPIKRDKLWYFGSYRDQQTGVTVAGFPVEAPSDFEFPTRLQNATYKFTYQLNQHNKIGHYIQMGRKLQSHRGASSTLYSNAEYKQDSISYAGNVDWNSVVSPTFFFNTRVATFGYNWPNLPYGANGELNDNLTLRIRDQGSGNTKGSDLPDRNDRRRAQFDWTGVWFRDNWAGANHSLKFGTVSELEGQIFKEEGFVGHYRTHFNSTGGAAEFSTPYRVQIYNTPRLSENWNWHHGAFINDQFQRGRATINAGLRWDFYNSYFPDEEVLPGPFRSFFYSGAPLPNSYGIPATPYATTFRIPGINDIRKFSSFAPRLGIAWDIFGNGKTTLKGNAGRFYQNTGIGSGTLNPVQSISYTFNWNDLNGDRVFQMNEFGTFATSSGATNNLISQDLKHTYTDSYSIWFERELMANMGLRAGYTYRNDGNNNSALQIDRVYSRYTLQRSFADPGVDGTVGTADDGPTIVAWDIPTPVPASRTNTTTVDDIIVSDRAFDITLTRRMSNRWSLQTDFLYNWDRDKGHVQNPNQERFNDNTVTIWSWKANGTYQAPWGLMVTPMLRYQAGDPRERIVQVTLNTGTLDYEAEQVGSFREESIWIFDARLEKRWRFTGNRSLGAFFDAFNIANSNAAEVQDNISGRRTTTVGGQSVNYQRFLRPTAVLAPRIFRFGFKLGF